MTVELAQATGIDPRGMTAGALFFHNGAVKTSHGKLQCRRGAHEAATDDDDVPFHSVSSG